MMFFKKNQMKMKIAFHDNSLSLRGTTVALYDYAYFTRKYIGNESIILYNNKHHANSEDVIRKFRKEFDVFGYDDPSQIDDILSKNRCELFFMEKGGSFDGIISKVCKNLVHAIGVCRNTDKHGDIFAMGSEWLSKMTNYEIPYVPYMVSLPDHNENLRSVLNIPEDALVLGRNGGWETFDLNWVKESIIEILSQRSDIWFLFQYTQPFIEHERVIYLPGSADLYEKVSFINTCDAMIHARFIGESFGLSCAEFSSRNKPVITWSGSQERSHIEILGESGIFYHDKFHLSNILSNIDKKVLNSNVWNNYNDYTPKKVIDKFKKVYLK